jgi:hypothetical protein
VKSPLLLVFLFVIPGAYGFDIGITDGETSFQFIPEHNRAFYYSWEAALFNSVELNNMLTLRQGFALGQIADILDMSAHGSVEFAFPFFRPYVPVSLGLNYIYNGFPDWETNIHTLLPLFSLQWRYFGFFAGPSLRFTKFARDPVLFELIAAYSVYLNFYKTDDGEVGIGLSNFSDFSAENLGAFSFNLYNTFRIGGRIFITTKLNIAMSGNTARITSVYGASFTEGILFKW